MSQCCNLEMDAKKDTKRKILFCSTAGEKAENLIKSLGCSCLEAENSFQDEQDVMLVAFPDYKSMNTSEIKEKFLEQTFLKVQEFVKARIRKKSGKVIFILPIQANGMNCPNSTDEVESELFYISQGGFSGFSKTITKEYSKKGVTSSFIYVDWSSVSFDELASQINSMACLSYPVSV